MANWIATRARQLRDVEIDAAIDEHVIRPGEPGHTDCGGWTWDPPCGGCDRCIVDQIVCYSEPWPYWVRQARREVVVLALTALASAAVVIALGVAL